MYNVKGNIQHNLVSKEIFKFKKNMNAPHKIDTTNTKSSCIMAGHRVPWGTPNFFYLDINFFFQNYLI